MYSRVTKKGDAVVFLGNVQIDLGFAIATEISDNQANIPAYFVSDLGGKTPQEFVSEHPSVDLSFNIVTDELGEDSYQLVGLAS